MSKFETKIVGKLNKYERDFILNRHNDFKMLINDNKKLMDVFLELIETNEAVIDGSPEEATNARYDILSIRRFLQDIQKNPEMHILDYLHYGDIMCAYPDAIGYCENSKTLSIWDITLRYGNHSRRHDLYATYAALYCMEHKLSVDDITVICYEYLAGVRYLVEVQKHHVVSAMVGISNFCNKIQEELE